MTDIYDDAPPLSPDQEPAHDMRVSAQELAEPYRKGIISIGKAMSLAQGTDAKLAAWRNGAREAFTLWAGVNRADISAELYRLAESRDLTDHFDVDAIQKILADEASAAKAKKANSAAPPLQPADTDLGVWDAGDDTAPIPPRGWLLGNTYCRRFLSSLVGDGGVGKTAIRYAQLLSAATGRSLTGEHVFVRSRVLIISLEDDDTELRRRIRAVCIHYGISQDELRGWLFLSAPGVNAGKLKIADKRGVIADGALGPKLEAEIVKHRIDIVVLDPLVKAHAVNENDNAQVDAVVGLLTELSIRHDIAIDTPHHVSKGTPDPGNANRARGASSMVNGGRLVSTATAMIPDEATTFGIVENERREYVRLDKAKVNITKSTGPAKWFRLISVDIGNGTDLYPNGDSVQVAEPWNPPETWADLSDDLCNQILTAIDAGLSDGDNYYTDAPKAQERAAWRLVQRHSPNKTEGQCREIIKTWIHNGVLERFDYENPATRKPVKGLKVNTTKRPG
jgi:hypothetical protein